MAFQVGGPELRAHGEVGQFGSGSSLGPIAVTRQYAVALQHTKYSIKPRGIKGYEKTRMQITKIRNIKAARWSRYNRGARIQDGEDLPQPGDPSTEGPADFVVFS